MHFKKKHFKKTKQLFIKQLDTVLFKQIWLKQEKTVLYLDVASSSDTLSDTLYDIKSYSKYLQHQNGK